MYRFSQSAVSSWKSNGMVIKPYRFMKGAFGLQKTLEEMTNEELLRLYCETKEQHIKQELALRYLYLAKSVAFQTYNLYSDYMQMEDIVNEGIIAIMKGIDRYDPERDNKFETFIAQRIRGMVIDIIRKNDWMPRNYHKDRQSIEVTSQQLAEEFGRTPTDEEVAERLNMNLKKYQRIQRMSTMVNVLSLDMITEREDNNQFVQIPSDDSSIQPEKAFFQGETVRVLAEAVDQLKEREKLVISLYYVEELSMTQIAQVLNVSEPRVSQIHSEVIKKLKNYMVSHFE